MEADIRWKQRLSNYNKAIATLKSAVDLSKKRELSDLEKQGTIQGFEFCFELAWNVMKDYLEEKGIGGIIGSKDAIRHAHKNNLIDDGQIWMDMLRDRNLASHVYDEVTANALFSVIINSYYAQMEILSVKMLDLARQ